MLAKGSSQKNPLLRKQRASSGQVRVARPQQKQQRATFLSARSRGQQHAVQQPFPSSAQQSTASHLTPKAERL